MKYSQHEATKMVRRELLSRADWEAAKILGDADAGLKTLLVHREDAFWEESKVWVGPETPKKITHFCLPPKLHGLAVIGGLGSLKLLLIKEQGLLDSGLAMRLGSFDPERDEVTSLVVTPRRLGSRLDVWVVVRRWKPELESRVYSAVLWMDSSDRQLRCSPALDDGTSTEAFWGAACSDHFPSWLKAAEFTSPPDCNPFSPEIGMLGPVRKKPEASLLSWNHSEQSYCFFRSRKGASLVIGKLETDPLGIARFEDVGWVRSVYRDNFSVLAGSGARRLYLWSAALPEPVSHLNSLFSAGHCTPGVLGIVIPYALIARVEQILPSACVGCAKVENKVVIATRDGFVRLLMPPPQPGRELWEGLWRSRWGSSNPEERVRRFLTEPVAEDPTLRAAWGLGIIDDLLNIAKPTDEILAATVDRLVVSESTSELRVALDSLSLALVDRWQYSPLRYEVVPKLLSMLYKRIASHELQERVDVRVRLVEPPEELSSENSGLHAFQVLKKYSTFTRASLYDSAKELESWVSNAHRAKHRCFVLLERWANCLLSSDWKEGDPKGPIALASGRLVVGEPGYLSISVVSSTGKIESSHPLHFGVEEPVSKVVFLDRASVLFFTVTGQSFIARLEEMKIEPLDFRVDGEVRAVCVAQQNGCTIVGVGSRDGYRSHLCIRRGERLQQVVLSTELEELSRIYTMGLIFRDGILHVAAGSPVSKKIFLWRANEDWELEQAQQWPLPTGVLDLCFTGENGLVAAGLDGFLTCFDIEVKGPRARRWTHALRGAIPTVQSVVLPDGTSCILAGSEYGRATLLRCRDGRRLWGFRAPGEIRQVATCPYAPGPLVLLLGHKGLQSFVPPKERDELLEEMLGIAANLPIPDRVSRDVYDLSVSAIQISRDPDGEEKAYEFLKRAHHRDLENRFLRLLAKQGVELDETFVRYLSMRQCWLATQLFEGSSVLTPVAERVLEGEITRPDTGDDGRRARAAAAVGLLRAGALDLSNGELLNEALLSEPWVALEYWRLLSEAASENDGLEQQLQRLERFPPTSLPYLLGLLEGDSRLVPLIEFLLHLDAGAPKGDGDSEIVGLLKLTSALESSKLAPLKYLLDFLVYSLEGDWEEIRGHIWAPLGRCSDLKLRPWKVVTDALPRRTLPPDSAPRRQRQEAFTSYARLLGQVVHNEEPSSAWASVESNLFVCFRQKMSVAVQRERRYLDHLTRGHLTLVDQHWISHDRLSIDFECVVEGHLPLEGLEVRVRGLKGFQEDAEQLLTFDYQEPKAFRFGARPAAGLSEVSVECETLIGEHRTREVWSFKINRTEAFRPTESAVLELQSFWQDLTDWLRRTSRKLILLVVESELEPRMIIRDLMDRFYQDSERGRVLDFDDPSTHTTSVSFRRVWEKIEQEVIQSSNRPDYLLLSGLERVLADLEKQGTAHSLMETLSLFAQEGTLTKTILVLSGRSLQRLGDTKDSPKLYLSKPQKPGQWDGRKPTASECREYDKERREWLWSLLRQRGTETLVDALLRRTGSDLRYLLLALPEVESGHSTRDDFIALIDTEFKMLAPSEFLMLLAGAQQVRLDTSDLLPGLVASEKVKSKPQKIKNVAKELVVPGQILTVEVIKILRDIRHPNLLVRGFRVGASYVESESGFVRIFPYLQESPLDICSRLSGSGKGTLHGLLFVTDEPYRTRLREQIAELGEAMTFEVATGLTAADCVQWDKLAGLDLETLAFLYPKLPKSDYLTLKTLSGLWQEKTPRARQLTACLDETFQEGLQTGTNKALLKDDGLLAALGPTFHSQFSGDHLVWCTKPDQRKVDNLSLKWDQVVQRSLGEGSPPKLIFIGPGADKLEKDSLGRLAILDTEVIKRGAAQSDRLYKGVRGVVNAQLSLHGLSPFKVAGALPPGSPLFVGRSTELRYIYKQIGEGNSVTIIGPRRMGKTSLLNKIYRDLSSMPEYGVVRLDLTGVKYSQEFTVRLCEALELNLESPTASQALKSAENKLAGRSGKTPVFLFNEIDDLALHDSDAVDAMRNRYESSRFVFVGYVPLMAELGRQKRPLFNFTVGLHFGGKAIYLGALSPGEGKELLSLLEKPPLELRWLPEQREEAHELLLSRSYRIPWVLQSFAQSLVLKLGHKRRSLSLDDALRVIEEDGDPAYREAVRFTPDSKSPILHKTCIKLLLLVLVRRHFFSNTGGAYLHIPKDPIIFTPEDAVAATSNWLKDIGYDQELVRFEAVVRPIRGEKLHDLFRQYCMAMLLEPWKDAHSESFVFFQNMLPLQYRTRRVGDLESDLLEALAALSAVQRRE